MRNTFRENNAEHSLMTAFIAHGLAVIENEMFGGSFDECRIGMIGAYHEASEVITGDMPTPIKYFSPEMKQAYKSVESVARDTILSTLPEKLRGEYEGIINATAEEYRLVKYADKLTAYIKCVEEMKSGNKEFLKAKDSIGKDIRAINDKAVKYFVSKILPSFEKTLDELEL